VLSVNISESFIYIALFVLATNKTFTFYVGTIRRLFYALLYIVQQRGLFDRKYLQS